MIADAIRNVQKYAQQESFDNLQRRQEQDFGPSIQFDTKGVEFGPWLRRFVAQVRRNWIIPYAAMSMRGHVVDHVQRPQGRPHHRPQRRQAVDRRRVHTVRRFNAILTSNPTMPLPPEYPDDKAFFTVTFYFNEQPPGR